MLRLIILGEERFNEDTNEFIPPTDNLILDLEHSLLSVSKWESKYEKPFLVPGKKTSDEIYDYLKAMVVTPDVDLGVLDTCSQQTLDTIQAYIDSSQTATTFGSMPERRGQGEVVTSELIYFWMSNFRLPFDPCETWHLNRLFALIRIANIKNSKPTKMSSRELAQRNRELNAQRREQLGTSG